MIDGHGLSLSPQFLKAVRVDAILARATETWRIILRLVDHGLLALGILFVNDFAKVPLFLAIVLLVTFGIVVLIIAKLNFVVEGMAA